MSESNGFVTREQMLAKAKRRYQEFEIPDFGKIRIRSLTERERSNFEADTLGSKGEFRKSKMVQARRKLIALTVVDASGDLLLNESGDVKALEEQDGAITDAIFEQAMVHCGIKENDIEVLVKNSGSVHDES